MPLCARRAAPVFTQTPKDTGLLPPNWKSRHISTPLRLASHSWHNLDACALKERFCCCFEPVFCLLTRSRADAGLRRFLVSGCFSGCKRKGDHAVPLPEMVSLRARVPLYSQKAPRFDLKSVPVSMMHSSVTLFWGYYHYLMHEKMGLREAWWPGIISPPHRECRLWGMKGSFSWMMGCYK